MKLNFKKGFTLIELLVVIAVIGLLSTIVMVSLNRARAKARDARRLSDLKQAVTALEVYYDAYGAYPNQVSYGENAAGGVGPWGGGPDYSFEDKDGDGIYWLDPLAENGIIKPMPIDPQNNSAHTYWYWKFNNYQGCSGDWISMAAYGLETGIGANADSDCLTSFDGNTSVYKITFPVK
jgi:prepilin-type N-terminal cleavage/methylation domain-containing protein